MEPNAYSLSEYMISEITLNANDVFKIHMTGDIWYGYSNLKQLAAASNFEAASSDDNIKVKSNGAGKYIIYSDYNATDYNKHIYIDEVGNAGSTPSTIDVTDVSLNKNSLYMQYRHEYNLSATVFPSHASNKQVFWTSSNPSIATVTSAGRVIANGSSNKGTTTITASTYDGSKTDTCLVYVSGDAIPDYYLGGTIGGISRSVDYRNCAGVPLGDGRYFIGSVQLKAGDKLKVYSKTKMGWLWKKNSTQAYESPAIEHDMVANIYLNPSDPNANYLNIVNKSSKEIFVSYPSTTNKDNYCAWLFVQGNDINPQWIKSSSLHTESTGSSFLIPNKAETLYIARAKRDQIPGDTYGSLSQIQKILGPYNIEEGTYNYDVSW